MIMVHDSAHERLLERIAAGDPVAQDERELLRACADCERIEREMDELRARLQRVGARRRDVVEVARMAPELADGRARLESLLEAQAPARPRRLAPMLIPVAAAMAAGVALWLWIGREPAHQDVPPAGTGVMLGSQDAEALHPLGPVPSYAPFRFRVRETGLGWYTVEVFDPERPSSQPLLRSPDLESGPELHAWTPTEAELAALPDTIGWRVRFDPADNSGPVVVGVFSASRSRP